MQNQSQPATAKAAKYTLEKNNPHAESGWGWTGLQSDSLDDILSRGREYAAKHHSERPGCLTRFRVVLADAERLPRTGMANADVASSVQIWPIKIA